MKPAREAIGCMALAGVLLASAAGRAETPASCPPTAGVPTAEQIQAGIRSARDRGFLWRITKAGRSSYLYGTIHVGKLEWAIPGPTVTSALRATNALALEIDVTNPVVAQSLARLSASGPSAPTLPPALRDRLERQATAACIASAALAPLHPVMQAITLTTLAARWDGLDPGYAQELSLAGAARSTERPIVSLETVESQIEALIPPDEDDAIDLVEDTLEQLEENRVRPVLARMSAAWENGNLADLEGYERWCNCAETDEEREFMKRMNDARNPHLADGIHALHLNGQNVFAAVGALHMIGPKALPTLMVERGYDVERVSFPP